MSEVFDPIAYLASKGKHGKPVSGGKEVTYACFFDCGRADDDRKRKLYVDVEEGYYHCHVCGASGGSYLLQQHFGDTPEKPDPHSPDPATRRNILNWAAEVGHQRLLANDDMLLYLLNERGLSIETIREAKLGWIGNRWSLTGNLPQQFTEAQLLTSGLVYKEGPRRGRDFFYDHLLIPYLHHGQVVQMRGKVMGAKYLTGPGEPVRIYGLDDLEGADDVIITEGEYDRLALKQHLQSAADDRARKTAVVGLAGANGFKDEHLPYFADAKRIFIGLDPDDTGKREAVKLKEKLGTRARILELPDELPKADWTDYLLPVPAGADASWHLAHPHAGHDWRDVMALLGNAAGKRVFTMGEAGHSYRTQRNEGEYVVTGYLGLDEAITGMKPGQVMVVLAKAQPNSEPVLTPTGWRPMGELSVGDLVIGRNGRPTQITGVYPQGEREVFTVHFSDGSSARSTDDHLWNWRHNLETPWRTSTLAELRTHLLRQQAKDRPRYRQVPLVQPVHFPAKDYELDPYTLGVLIGDGCFRHGSPEISTDHELVDALVLPGSVKPRWQRENGEGVGDYLLTEPGVSGNALLKVLRNLGLHGHLSREKFIPQEYLLGSVDQRWALLQGLLDTDGTVDSGGTTPVFCTASLRLAEDFVDLSRSLGGVASIRPFMVQGQEYYRVSPALPASLGCPFRLTKKALRWRPSSHLPTRRLTDITPAGREESTCIKVAAEDELYVTAGFNITHNTGTGKTVLLCNLAYNMREHKILFVSLEMTREEVYERMLRIYLFHHPKATEREAEIAMSNVYLCDENRLGEKDLNQLVDEFEIESGERPDVVFVDYLGYYARGARGNTPYERVTNAVMQLKAEAKAGRFVVISPSQVNRLAKEGQPIDLDDARDSGAIEETADFLLSIWRPDDALQEQDANAPQSGKIMMTILKSRHGGKDKQFTLVMDLLTLALVDANTREAKRASDHNILAWRGSKWADIRRAETRPTQQPIDLRGLS